MVLKLSDIILKIWVLPLMASLNKMEGILKWRGLDLNRRDHWSACNLPSCYIKHCPLTVPIERWNFRLLALLVRMNPITTARPLSRHKFHKLRAPRFLASDSHQIIFPRGKLWVLRPGRHWLWQFSNFRSASMPISQRVPLAIKELGHLFRPTRFRVTVPDLVSSLKC